MMLIFRQGHKIYHPDVECATKQIPLCEDEDEDQASSNVPGTGRGGVPCYWFNPFLIQGVPRPKLRMVLFEGLLVQKYIPEIVEIFARWLTRAFFPAPSFLTKSKKQRTGLGIGTCDRHVRVHVCACSPFQRSGQLSRAPARNSS